VSSPLAIPGSQRGDGAPQLLAQDGELDRAEALAAVLLGDGDARPAELGQLAPQRVVDTGGLGVLAHPLRRRTRAEQLPRRALDVALVVGEPEVH
jgi:hypothetical protein